ncbi:MAG: hypothetical protein U5R14_13700 [Gemmatimonadota bacterium]|nr:hypothetical protein [Gemmatimonadota bacterium]
MIFKKYGDTYQSVDPNFDSKALNEVSFRRNRARAISLEELEERYERGDVHELVSEAEGDVQDETEQVLLDRLRQQLDTLVENLDEDEVLIVENEQGHDYPKTRQKISNVIVEGENRLRFSYSIAPPLRVSVYRPRS